LSIEAMDAWVSIPFIMISCSPGLAAMPKGCAEAAKVDGRLDGSRFWHVTFPINAAGEASPVLIIRIIFKLKLAEHRNQNVTAGDQRATDTVSSFIYRGVPPIDRMSDTARGARHVLSSPHHHLPDGVADACPALDAESWHKSARSKPVLKGVARLAFSPRRRQPVRKHHARPGGRSGF